MWPERQTPGSSSALSRLRRRSEADPQARPALEFYRAAEATLVVHEGEALMAASA